jgi:hypothetical protein
VLGHFIETWLLLLLEMTPAGTGTGDGRWYSEQQTLWYNHRRQFNLGEENEVVFL